jgi:opacity protein-like surface antigen
MGTHGLDENETAFGFNIGVGAEYYLQSNLKLSLDIKYQNAKKSKSVSYTDPYTGISVSTDVDVLKANGPVFQLGIAYVF